MTYILLIILTLSSANQETKDFVFRISYSNKEECLDASKKLDFSDKYNEKEMKTKSVCIPWDAMQI